MINARQVLQSVSPAFHFTTSTNGDKLNTVKQQTKRYITRREILNKRSQRQGKTISRKQTKYAANKRHTESSGEKSRQNVKLYDHSETKRQQDNRRCQTPPPVLPFLGSLCCQLPANMCKHDVIHKTGSI